MLWHLVERWHALVRNRGNPKVPTSTNRFEGWFGRFKPRVRLTQGLKRRTHPTCTEDLRDETLGKLLNYMAMGLPTVAFDVPVAREVPGRPWALCRDRQCSKLGKMHQPTVGTPPVRFRRAARTQVPTPGTRP